MPASIGDNHIGADEERVAWSVLAEIECHLDAALVYGDREEVVISGAGRVLQQQQTGVRVASYSQLDPARQLARRSEQSSTLALILTD